MERNNDWFSESLGFGTEFRKDYLKSVEKFIENRQEEFKSLRKNYCKAILETPETYRTEYLKMLGYPLNEPRDENTVPKVNKSFVGEDKFCKIYSLQIEVIKGFKFYGLYFKTKQTAKAPLVISQHGGLGTPELCSSFKDSSNYNNMTRRIADKGVNVFAPQLLLWRRDGDEPDFDRHNLDGALKQVGSSLTALEIYCLQRSLDYFCSLPEIDENNIGMVGLSYGGYYTLHLAAADKRIKSAITCSHFNNRSKYCWSDYCYLNSLKKFSDAEVALLVRPRKLQIFVGNNDHLFDHLQAKAEYNAIKEYDKNADEWLSFEIFDGTHEFYPKSDLPIIKLLNDLK